MASLLSIQYKTYLEVLKFLTHKKYRNYKIINNKIKDEETFKRFMPIDKYVKIECEDEEKNKIFVLFMKEKTPYVEKTGAFRELVGEFKKFKKINLIFITKEPFSVYIRKIIPQFEDINIEIVNYLHRIFASEIPLGPCVPSHRIMSSVEKKKILSVLKINELALPIICIKDPQCIWLGAKVGEIIEIVGSSQATGHYTRYRIVSQTSHKVIETESVDTDTDEEDFDELDESVYDRAAEEELNKLEEAEIQKKQKEQQKESKDEKKSA